MTTTTIDPKTDQMLSPMFDRLNELKDRVSTDLNPMLDVLGVWVYLEGSENQIIQAMWHSGIWPPPQPPDLNLPGSSLFGLIPYWIHNPPAFLAPYLESEAEKHEGFKLFWNALKLALPTRLLPADYAALMAAVTKGGVVAADGGFIGTSFYEDIDPHWLLALLDYIVVMLDAKERASFTPNPGPAQVELTGANEDQVTIALVGDWGTGDYGPVNPAAAVMAQLAAKNPDYIVHLGDVYYAGTTGDFVPLDEETKNYLELWPKAAAGKSFMLNSNHEMYSGAQGYLDALQDPSAIFAAQNQGNYFLLTYNGYALLGLDSAYYDTSAMFMDGGIGDVGTEQVNWIQSLNLSPEKTIVLTHHNGLHYDGTSTVGSAKLWAQVNAALKGDPKAWYWGHVHNGVVYSTPTVTGSQTLARCVGHGAFPFGNAWGLGDQTKKLWDYYAQTPYPCWPLHVRNGFAILTITKSGLVTEDFYEVENDTPAHSNQYHLG